MGTLSTILTLETVDGREFLNGLHTNSDTGRLYSGTVYSDRHHHERPSCEEDQGERVEDSVHTDCLVGAYPDPAHRAAACIGKQQESFR